MDLEHDDRRWCPQSAVLPGIDTGISPDPEKTGILSAIFAIAGDVLSFLVVYLVCTSVAEVMVQLAASDIADKGNSVWKINLVCYAVSAILSVLAIIPLINIIAAVLQVVVAVVQIVALVLYMIFLKKSSEKLAA